jgi:DNA-binding transcriptional LysR family regulator
MASDAQDLRGKVGQSGDRVVAGVDLRLLRYFVAVAEEGGFSGAARRLGMTQPALSRAVRSLEAAVGVGLVVRAPGAVVVTEAGGVLLEEARDLDDRVRAAVGRVRAAGRGGGPGDGAGLRRAAGPPGCWGCLARRAA